MRHGILLEIANMMGHSRMEVSLNLKEINGLTVTGTSTDPSNVVTLRRIGVVGVSFKTAPIVVREKLVGELSIETIEEFK